jgi:calcium-dependent protein kinase
LVELLEVFTWYFKDNNARSLLKPVLLLTRKLPFSFQVIAESLSEEEIAGLKEMFKMIDADNSGHITLEELKTGLEKVGANTKDSEIAGLMQAVSLFEIQIQGFYSYIA